MKLSDLKVSRYRSLREETIPLRNLNVFIGTNGSGKSTIFDALRFLHDGVQDRDFRDAVFRKRGGFLNLAWKGEDARQIQLTTCFREGEQEYEWDVKLNKDFYGFHVNETVKALHRNGPPQVYLEADRGAGHWWSGQENRYVPLKLEETTCGLAAAAADASFPARAIAEFVSRWGFFDPNPFLLRKDWALDSPRFDPFGRNLAERLFLLEQTSPDTFGQIEMATQSVLGLPSKIEPRESRESEGGFYFAQREPGLKHTVHQMGVSSGTLRMLALMTALFSETGTNLIGIEEPENYVHPTALREFAKYLLKASEHVQILVTTHSPLLLDFLNDPAAVCVVRNIAEQGTHVIREQNPDGIRQALEESGFGLGELYETKGFGG